MTAKFVQGVQQELNKKKYGVDAAALTTGIIQVAVDITSDRDCSIVFDRFDGDMTYMQIAQKVGLSDSRVRAICLSFVNLLSDYMKLEREGHLKVEDDRIEIYMESDIVCLIHTFGSKVYSSLKAAGIGTISDLIVFVRTGEIYKTEFTNLSEAGLKEVVDFVHNLEQDGIV